MDTHKPSHFRHFATAVAVGLCWFLAVLWLVGAPAHAFTIGVYDPTFGSSDAAIRTPALDRAAGVRSAMVRLPVRWASVAPATRPEGFDPPNPADPAYRWGSLDSAVQAAQAHGMEVLLSVNGAPTWAQGADAPSSAATGSWKPDPSAFGQFATAIARRYSGRFTPVGAAVPLPRVRVFQAWNEPNLSLYLSPQWERIGGTYEPFAANRYRAMLNAFSAGIHSVAADNTVVTAGTAPYGDPNRGDARTRPVLFWQSVFCLSSSLQKRTCADTTNFDVLSHHPYSVGGPLKHAISPLDAAVPDIGRIRNVLEAAIKRRTVAPRRPRIWVTEISWDSQPPDPQGVPLEKHARWLEQSLYVLWRQRVTSVLWFRVADEAPGASYNATTQSGLYLFSGQAKPAAQAFAFPFVVDRSRRTVWGMAPRRGKVELQRLAGGRWRTVRTVSTANDRVFSARLDAGKARWRAVQGPAASLSWGRSADGLG